MTGKPHISPKLFAHKLIVFEPRLCTSTRCFYGYCNWFLTRRLESALRNHCDSVRLPTSLTLNRRTQRRCARGTSLGFYRTLSCSRVHRNSRFFPDRHS